MQQTLCKPEEEDRDEDEGGVGLTEALVEGRGEDFAEGPGSDANMVGPSLSSRFLFLFFFFLSFFLSFFFLGCGRAPKPSPSTGATAGAAGLACSLDFSSLEFSSSLDP